MNSEIRNPKSERNPNPETRRLVGPRLYAGDASPKVPRPRLTSGAIARRFRISDFLRLPLRILPRLAPTLSAALLLPANAFACAACYGKTDSALADGMNSGIFALLGVVALVLGGIATFFVFLARRAATLAAAEAASGPAESAKIV